MTAWKRNALRLFPERRLDFASARSVKDILSSLEADFRQSSGTSADDLGSRMIDYLRECLRRSKHDEFERRIIHERLVHWGSERRLRELVFQVLSPDRFLEEQKIFEERLEAADFDQVWISFVAAQLQGIGPPKPANTR